MSAGFWSSRPTKSHVTARRLKRLGVERLEAREVPAVFLGTHFDDPFFFPADGLSSRQAITSLSNLPAPGGTDLLHLPDALPQ